VTQRKHSTICMCTVYYCIWVYVWHELLYCRDKETQGGT